jgi:glycosyltransferase involved in cell wall biosynthesis
MLHPRLDLRGGAENVVLWLSTGLARRGHALSVAAPRFDPACWEPGEWDGVAVHALAPRMGRFATRAGRARAHARAASALARDCDLVVAHGFPAAVWATLARGRAGGARVAWYCHEPHDRLYWREIRPHLARAAEHPEQHAWLDGRLRQPAPPSRSALRRQRIDRRLDRRAVERVDLVLANSAFTAANVAAVHGREAAVCRPGVPPPPGDLPAAGGPAYVAWVAASGQHKNAAGLVEALRIAVRERGAHDLRVRAVGADRERVGVLAARAGVAEVLCFEPRLPARELHALLAGARLVVDPPIDEPFGLVPLEAMAHARPVVACRAGGPTEVVVPGVTGLLAEPLDPAALADCLLAPWRDAQLAERLGRAGRERFLAEFTLERFLDRFEALAGIA